MERCPVCIAEQNKDRQAGIVRGCDIPTSRLDGGGWARLSELRGAVFRCRNREIDAEAARAEWIDLPPQWIRDRPDASCAEAPQQHAWRMT